MAPQVEITVPSTSVSSSEKPYTIYNISLRLPLRSFSLQKRYSDFTALHQSLTSQSSQSPPVPLPPKSYFRSTLSSPELTENRRQGLERYLQTINTSPDDRWRATSAWRSFLNLPSSSNASISATTRSSAATSLNSLASTLGKVPITDPVIWLDQHRDLKAALHDARLHLTRRDQASGVQAQHEASTQAKKSLVHAGAMITQLEDGLTHLASSKAGATKLGEGELRRRRDLVNSATREKEGLENLLSAIAAKSVLDRTVASANEDQRRKAAVLSGAASNHNANDDASSTNTESSSIKPARRVLGGGGKPAKETERTKALDNQGVVQLQRQLMQEQDEDVTVLAKAVARQKDLGIQIQEELAVQGELLDMLDEDVGRVQGKVDVARKRVKKIS